MMRFARRCDFGFPLSFFVLHRVITLAFSKSFSAFRGFARVAAKGVEPGARQGAPKIMTESEFEIHWDFTEAEYAAYEALRARQRAWTRSFWSSLTAQVVFGGAVSGLVSLLAVASGASSPQAGGIIAVLAFAAFYAGLWTPSIGDRLSRASRFGLFKTYIGDCRLSVTDTGIWVSNDSGRRSFVPYSSIGSTRVSNTLLVLSPKTDGIFALLAVPVRLLTPERQARIIELVRAHAPRAS